MREDDPDKSGCIALAADMEGRIEGICSLYSPDQRHQVVSEIISALHLQASLVDPGGAWLHLALEGCRVDPRGIGEAPTCGSTSDPPRHPSRGDAEDLGQDIAMSRLQLPTEASALVSIRIAVHVAWTRFATTMRPSDRARLAIEAAALA